MNERRFTRRQAAVLIVASAVATTLFKRTLRAGPTGESSSMIERAIPSSGEKLPVIGLGTWQVFDVAPEREAALEPVLAEFVKLGGRLVDSSPMYGRGEQVVGHLSSKLKLRDALFLATKVWTRGRPAGVESMQRSLARMQTNRLDLMQVHNLVDAGTQLATLREWKAQGRLRYIGITHYNSSAYAEVERMLRSERVDFLQINYSLAELEAEQRILPAAQERGVAVIINRPFGAGELFARVRNKPLPGFGRVGLHFLGAAHVEMDHRASGGDLCHSGDKQTGAFAGQHESGVRPVARREDAGANGGGDREISRSKRRPEAACEMQNAECSSIKIRVTLPA